MRINELITFLPGLVIGITLHEAAHAWSSMLLGDRLAYSQGRVTLNPLKHLSPLGTLALFVIGFGWGRPVAVNLYNFKRPKFYYLLSSLAGPAANLAICIICMIGLRFTGENTVARSLLQGTYIINGILCMLNLLPIPPLDGSKIWPCVIPGMRPLSSGKLDLIGTIVVVVLIFSNTAHALIFKMLSILTSVLSHIIP